MSRINTFLLIELVIVLTSAVVIFKSFKIFFQSAYSAAFRGYYLFSKKLWNKHFDRSMKFEFFLLVSMVLTGINILLFRYIL